MEALGSRRGDLQDMQPDGKGRVRLDHPGPGLIGFQSDFLTMTRGTGVMSHVFDDYGPMKPEIAERRDGVLVSAEDGEAVATRPGSCRSAAACSWTPASRFTKAWSWDCTAATTISS